MNDCVAGSHSPALNICTRLFWIYVENLMLRCGAEKPLEPLMQGGSWLCCLLLTLEEMSSGNWTSHTHKDTGASISHSLPGPLGQESVQIFTLATLADAKTEGQKTSHRKSPETSRTFLMSSTQLGWGVCAPEKPGLPAPCVEKPG